MPERQCRGCTKQKEWGCEAKEWVKLDEHGKPQIDEEGEVETWWSKPAHIPLNFDGRETYACPRQDLKENGYTWHRALLYYGMYKNGFLPGPGAVVDQSNFAVALFRLFDDVNHECDLQQDEQRRRKAAEDPPPAAPQRIKGRPPPRR